ncbi:hypothetical protein TSMEX_007666 [Taenia solium]|eukprot:TsM_000373800 transcript=TsM_000373800 gene=TsM_000373800
MLRKCPAITVNCKHACAWFFVPMKIQPISSVKAQLLEGGLRPNGLGARVVSLAGVPRESGPD